MKDHIVGKIVSLFHAMSYMRSYYFSISFLSTINPWLDSMPIALLYLKNWFSSIITLSSSIF